MKKLILSLAFILSSGLAIQSFAQYGPEWGETEQDRRNMLRAYNFLNDNIKSKNYDKAAYYFQQLMEGAPAAHVNIYVHGLNLYKGRINEAQDREQKKMYVDSLMTVYDLGIKNIGDKDPVRRVQFIQAKAFDYLEYNPTDRKGIAERFRASIEELGDQIDPNVIVVYFNELTTDFKNDDVSTEDYLSEFDRLTTVLGTLSAAEQSKQLEQFLGSSGAANCAALEEIYGQQIEENPDDAELLEKTVALLNSANCTGTDFYLKTAELFHKVKPSSRSAVLLGYWYQEKGNGQMAMRFFNEALSLTENPEERASVSMTVAVMQLNNNQYREAYNYARQALAPNGQNAEAFYIIAMAYAGASRGLSDDFTRQTVYWLVVDNLQNARRIVAANPGGSLTMADLDKLIATYQASFPPVEELFFKGLDEGASYTVSAGWISGQTTVRKRP